MMFFAEINTIICFLGLLFKKTYTKRTGIHIDPCDIEHLRQFKSTLQWLAVLYTLSSVFSPKNERKFLKQEINKRKRLQNVFNAKTGQR